MIFHPYHPYPDPVEFKELQELEFDLNDDDIRRIKEAAEWKELDESMWRPGR